MGQDKRVEMAARLLTPGERLGWEFVRPREMLPHPETATPPVWREAPFLLPGAPRVVRPKPYTGVMNALLVISLVASSIGAMVSSVQKDHTRTAAWGAALVAAIVATVLLHTLLPSRLDAALYRRLRRERDARHAEFQRAFAEWQARMTAHHEAEAHRYTTTPVWFPLSLASAPHRLDVVGDNGPGWQALLATHGCSLLAAGGGMLLVDLTERGVGAGLSALATVDGRPVRRLDATDQGPRWDPLAGLDAPELVELLAASVVGAHPAGVRPEHDLPMHIELLSLVTDRLDPPWTAPRLAAGLRALRGHYQTRRPGLLTPQEIERLADAVDDAGDGEEVRRGLRTLYGFLDLLAPLPADPEESGKEDGGGTQEPLWTTSGLTVLEVRTGHRRRKEFLDQLVVHRVQHELRDPAAGRQTLVVAGADRLAPAGLRALAAAGQRAGVRLVLMLERLGEFADLVGSHHSATVLMRLGNGKDAAVAAEFIGRGHTFVLGQTSVQVGVNDSSGTSSGTTRTSGSGGGSGGSSWSSSTSDQESVTTSSGTSESLSASLNRVYEFTVEPTALQGLHTTAFFLVETGPGGRRVVLGDANPALSLSTRISPTPRPAVTGT